MSKTSKTTAIQTANQNKSFSDETHRLRKLWDAAGAELLGLYYETGRSASRVLYGITRDPASGELREDPDTATQKYGSHDTAEFAQAVGVQEDNLYRSVLFFKLVPEDLKNRLTTVGDGEKRCVSWKKMIRLLHSRIPDDKKCKLLTSAVENKWTGREFDQRLQKLVEHAQKSAVAAGRNVSSLSSLNGTVSFLRRVNVKVSEFDQLLKLCKSEDSRNAPKIRERLESIRDGAASIQKGLAKMLDKIEAALK